MEQMQDFEIKGNHTAEQTETAFTEGPEKKPVRLSVRSLVEFLLRSGDLDNRSQRGSDTEAMQAGSRIHRRIQKQMGSGYRAEVSLKYEHEYPHSILLLEGRADGIFTQKDRIVIDEIKSTYQDLRHLEEPKEVHLAQAKCYAAIYLRQHDLTEISVQMTYAQMESEEVRRFSYDYEKKDLLAWFDHLLDQYERWAEWQVLWEMERNASMQGLDFPFPYRPGQKKLVRDVYLTIYRKRQLFVQASTGVGKTMSTVYPSVRALGEGIGEKIFYLTAKTITRTVAEEAFSILREHGLACKFLTITAKERICVCEETECNPEYCPRAKGHFDRINDCMYEMLSQQTDYRRESILAQSQKWQVCPYELQLELSYFMDSIICDYNYVLDPTVRLRRFFGEGSRKGDYIFLIDEAHNLADRARKMYSAQVCKEDFLDMRRMLQPVDEKLAASLASCNRQLLVLKQEWEASGEACCRYEHVDAFLMSLLRMIGRMEDFLDRLRKGEVKFSPSQPAKKKSRRKKKQDNGQLSFNFAEATGHNGKDSTVGLAASAGPAAEIILDYPGSGTAAEPRSEIVPEYPDRGASADAWAEIVSEYPDRGTAAEPRSEIVPEYPDKGTAADSGQENASGFWDFGTELQMADAPSSADVSGGEKAGISEDQFRSMRKRLMEFYFDAKFFAQIYELLDENYMIYSRMTAEGRFLLRLFCVNPAGNLQTCLDRGRAAVYFSATLLPIRYYRNMLSGRGEEDYATYVPSPFDTEKRFLCIASDVSSKYTRRGPGEYLRMADYIFRICSARSGNYMIYFPSYKMLEDVYEVFAEKFASEDMQCICQEPRMDEEERERFLDSFGQDRQNGTLIGFCVMGGIFAEGIDLIGERLIGAVVIGTGLPQIGEERELLKQYYDRKNSDGFAYAYRFPGMNRVLQAAGRVIRTDRDRGVILLLDERFRYREYRELFPREWNDCTYSSLERIQQLLREFWEKSDIAEK